MTDETIDDTGPSISDYEVGQHNVQKYGLDFHNPVFGISAGVIIVFVAATLLMPDLSEEFFGWLRPALTAQFDWVFLLTANVFVLFCLFLIVSPFGKIRLGGKLARPDYSYVSWFSMLFAAGMGIGLMFYGVSEPIDRKSVV